MDRDDIVDNIKLSKILNDKRIALAITYKELALKTGISKSTLQRYLTGGINNIPAHKISIISKSLNLNPSVFFDKSNMQQNKEIKKEVETMKFLDLLQGSTEISGEIITGVEDMPATFEWDRDAYMLPDGIEHFRELMEWEANLTPYGDIILEGCDHELAKEFVIAAAGYISAEAYDRYFGRMEEHRIYVEFTAYGHVYVEGTDVEDALKRAKERVNELPLPDNWTYVDDTYHIDEEATRANY